jgi:hypothetical protein
MLPPRPEMDPAVARTKTATAMLAKDEGGENGGLCVGAPLALGSAAGACLAAWLAAGARTRACDYPFLIVVVVLSIIGLIVVDGTKYSQHT